MLTPNTLLQNRYRIAQLLGQEGAATLYLAEDQQTGSTIAVREFIFDDSNNREAVEHRARQLSSLSHPALPEVLEYFAEGGAQYLVTERIEGETLAEKIEERGAPFSPEEVIRWGRCVA